MDKIYLLIQDYVVDSNAELKISAYKTIKGAKTALKDAVKESKPTDKENGFEVYTDKSTEYEAYIEGYYIDNHTHIYIKEVEVEN